MLVEQHRTIERGAGGDFRAEGVTYLTRATALGLYDDGYVTVLEHADELDRIWHVRARRVILATGAFERSIAFADNDRAGVMLSNAASRYLEHGVLVGSRTVVFTARGGAYGTASNFVAKGGEVPAIADVSGTEPDLGDARDAEVLPGWVVSGTEGDRWLEAVHLEGPDGDRRTIECDSLLVSGGWNPNLGLWRSIGGGLRSRPGTRSCRPRSVLAVGCRRRRGRGAGEPPLVVVEDGDDAEKFVDLQRDQTVADIGAALEDGLRSVEHVKRATYIGTAVDQGRTSGVLAAEIVNHLLSQGPGARVRRTPGRRTSPCPSPRSPARSEATCSIRSERHRCTCGTSSAAPCSRTWGSGSVRGPSLAPGNRWSGRSNASAERSATVSGRWTRPRSARSRWSAPTHRPSSTGCTRTGCRTWRSGRSGTA